MSFGYEAESSFLQAMAACGIAPSKPLEFVPDLKIRRFRVDGDKPGSRNGWFWCCVESGFYAGAFGSWKTGVSEIWVSKDKREFSSDERRIWKLRVEEMAQKRDAEIAALQAAAAEKAKKLWERAKPAFANCHPYLTEKGVKPYGLRLMGKSLLVPVRDSDGELVNLQFIFPEGKKVFLTGGKIKGCYMAIGKPNGVLCIGEGFATGASVREATNHAVAIAFFADNLLSVARVLQEKFPDITIVCCADNDIATEGNPGLSKARECAEQVGGVLAVAEFQDQPTDGSVWTDFNDMHVQIGLAAVCAAVDQALAGNIQLAPAAGDVGVTMPVEPVEKVAVKDKAYFEEVIDECSDFDHLTDTLLRVMYASKLKRPAVEALLSRIAKKTFVTKKGLIDEYNALGRAGAGGDDQHPSDDDVIAELNKEHAVLPLGGRTVILNRQWDPVLKRKIVSFSTKADFELKYCNKRAWDRNSMVPWGEYWLNHPERAEYRGMVFLPGGEEEGYLNLWQGWGVEPVPGDSHAAYLEFVWEVICSKDDDLYEYIISWLAHLVQRPQELPETALVFRGKEGIGKNTFVDPLFQIVGNEHSLLLSSLGQITGRFSGHLSNTLLVFCNESVWGGDKSAQGVLKSMITDAIQPVEFKGKDLTMLRSFKRLIFATNETWAVPRGEDDRRYVITDVSSGRKGDYRYFKAVRDSLANGGVNALYHYLLKFNIEGWHPRNIPKYLLERGWEMKIMSAGSVIRWWFDALLSGFIFEMPDAYSEEARFGWPEIAVFKDFESAYLGYCKRYNITHPEHSSIVGKTLKEYGVKLGKKARNGEDRSQKYILESLDACRELFSTRWSIPPSAWKDRVG